MKVVLTALGLGFASAYIALAAQGIQRVVDSNPQTSDGFGTAFVQLNWPNSFPQQLEVFGFIAGVIAVYLVVKESLWNWPIGMVNVSAYAFFFFSPEVKHFANGWLQIIYLGYLIEGWYRWTRRTPGEEKLRIRKMEPTYWWWVAITIGVVTALLTPVLSNYGGSAPFWDALTFGISLAAQLLLNRKLLESWILWIVVDAIYVPLYLFRPWFAGDPSAASYYPTAILYAIFLGLAILGYQTWRKELVTERAS